MDGGIGTSYEVGEDGLFTGKLGGTFMYGEGKVEAIRRYADEHDIDLAASYAYSDSVSDLPMLRAVGHPVVVNPDDGLARIAKEEGWRVMRFERLGRRLVLSALSVTLVTAALLSRNRIAAWRQTTSRTPALRAKRS
jgi:phosphoserine phosphatase